MGIVFHAVQAGVYFADGIGMIAYVIQTILDRFEGRRSAHRRCRRLGRSIRLLQFEIERPCSEAAAVRLLRRQDRFAIRRVCVRESNRIDRCDVIISVLLSNCLVRDELSIRIRSYSKHNCIFRSIYSNAVPVCTCLSNLECPSSFLCKYQRSKVNLASRIILYFFVELEVGCINSISKGSNSFRFEGEFFVTKSDFFSIGIYKNLLTYKSISCIRSIAVNKRFFNIYVFFDDTSLSIRQLRPLINRCSNINTLAIYFCFSYRIMQPCRNSFNRQLLSSSQRSMSNTIYELNLAIILGNPVLGYVCIITT